MYIKTVYYTLIIALFFFLAMQVYPTDLTSVRSSGSIVHADNIFIYENDKVTQCSDIFWGENLTDSSVITKYNWIKMTVGEFLSWNHTAPKYISLSLFVEISTCWYNFSQNSLFYVKNEWIHVAFILRILPNPVGGPFNFTIYL